MKVIKKGSYKELEKVGVELAQKDSSSVLVGLNKEKFVKSKTEKDFKYVEYEKIIVSNRVDKIESFVKNNPQYKSFVFLDMIEVEEKTLKVEVEYIEKSFGVSVTILSIM